MKYFAIVTAALIGSALTISPGQATPVGKRQEPPAPVQALPRNAPGIPRNVTAHRDLAYVEGGHARQKLDLYLPAEKAEGAAPLPILVWVHGGGWQSGDKSQCPPLRQGFVERGYAVASIGYRLSGDAPFPAQIEDVKAAIRYLRAHARQYNLDPDHIGAWGSSAGGHLVALLGTSDGLAASDKASRVQAVCDFYGPTDLVRMAQTSGYERHATADSPESKLLGGPVLESKEKAERANPIAHIDKAVPPFLIVHGDSDPVVPPDQSRMLFDALKKAAIPVRLHILHGAGHGGPGFASPEVTQMVTAFFDRTLRGKATDQTAEPAESRITESRVAETVAPARERPRWEQVIARRDANGDGKLSASEFPGPPPLFRRLDRNEDGQITREEFEAAPPRPFGAATQ